MSKKYLVISNCKENEPEFEGVFNTRKEAILYIAFRTDHFHDASERRKAVEKLINKEPAGDRSCNFHIAGIAADQLKPFPIKISKKNAKTSAFIDTQFAKKAEEKRNRYSKIQDDSSEEDSEEEPQASRKTKSLEQMDR